ncbi:MAG: hypothetical protein AABW49_02895 [Nanoarchaeota archaeon]
MTNELVQYFVENDFLLSPEIIDLIKDKKEFVDLVKKFIKNNEKLLVLNDDIYNNLTQMHQLIDFNWSEFEKSRSYFEKNSDEKIYSTFVDILSYNIEKKKTKQIDKILEEIKHEPTEEFLLKEDNLRSNVMILNSWDLDVGKRTVQDFVKHFRARYNQLKKILECRPELQNCISINRLYNKKDKEQVAVIAMVADKSITKNGNILITLEDLTGKTKLLISKNNPIFSIGKDITEDEVIGVIGITGDNIIFANTIFQPDIPTTKELKKCPEEVYAGFISDIHFGSKKFLKEDFLRMVEWINGNTGNNQQKSISKRLKYIFIIGDVVDGVGIYPDQDKELEIKDITQQYSLAAEYLDKIRKDINIILCPGQHDAVRISEPQPSLNNEYTKSLNKISNLKLVSNPALINIHASEDFPGFDVLIYHGASYHYYNNNIDSLRQSGAQNNPTLVIKYLLKRRHLAPTHGSSLYSPQTEKDAMVIEKIPDIFASGDSHRCETAMYNNISIIGSSCFQAKTAFQEKVGNNPNPSRLPIINLKTREIKILNFSEEQ